MDSGLVGALAAATHAAVHEPSARARSDRPNIDPEHVEAAAEVATETVSADTLLTAFRSDTLAVAIDRNAEVDRETFLTAVAEHVEAADVDVDALVDRYLTELQNRLTSDLAALREIVRYDTTTSDDVRRLSTQHEAPGDSVRGFDQLTRADLENGRVNDEHCWRRAFTPAEAWVGYPLERERPLADGGRRNLTNELLDTLAEGGAAALLGAPGSGKTTATRMAMAEWVRRHNDGTVFYRRQGVQSPLSPATLMQAVESARKDGPVLVAVEDVARPGSYPVYEVAAEFERTDDVCFLVNSRERELLDSASDLREVYDDARRYQDVVQVRSAVFTSVDMPSLDAREIERFTENYSEVTGKKVSLGSDSDAILSQIRYHSGVSPMLLLAYYLPVWQTETSADRNVSALTENVRQVFRYVHGESELTPGTEGGEQTLMMQVALAVNVLNAAEVPVRKEFLLALGDDATDRDTILRVADHLRGQILFNEGDNGEFETHHPLWSRLYLSEQLNRGQGGEPVRMFETVVNALFRLFDDETLREDIRKTLRTDTQLLIQIEQGREKAARRFVENVFKIGEDRPELQPLYGTSKYSRIELPSAGGARTAVKAAFSRAKMFNSRGESERELAETEWAWERATEEGIDDGEIAARYHTQRGHYARRQGDFETAREHYEQAREKALGDHQSQHEAKSLDNLGVVARSLGEYEEAREYHERSLEIKREIGDRAGEADSLDNLGVVARSLGEYEEAREYHERSLAIRQEIGDRAGEADSLGNLGVVAGSLGEYEQAREYHEESLALKREIGDRAGEANSLGNLGVLARSLGEYEQAHEYHEESLAIRQKIGDRAGEANSLDNLGVVARSLGEYEEAREYHETSLEIKREIGDRADEANSLDNLGVVARSLGEYEQAREYHEESLALRREIGDRAGEANSLANLGAVGHEQENYEAAIRNYSGATDVFREIGVVRRTLNVLSNLTQAAAAAGDNTTAVDACEEALDLIEQSDLDGLAQRAREFRIRLARLDDTPAGTVRLYYHALGHALEEDVATATKLFGDLWRRHDYEDETVVSVALAGGVALAALAETRESDTEPDVDTEMILETVSDREDVLGAPERDVYVALSGSDPGTTPDDFREVAENIDPDSFAEEVQQLEYSVFADLFEEVHYDNELVAEDAERSYNLALAALTRDDLERATGHFRQAWRAREEHDPSTEAYDAATAAGVGLAAHQVLLDDIEPEAAPLAEIENLAGLSPAVKAVATRLHGDDPATTSEELREVADTTDDPSPADLETIAFAEMLRALND
jgi:tetratricopeptide (TPR) repeat protein